MTIKVRLSKMLFFLCFRRTIKFQGRSPVDPLFKPPADPPFDSTSQKKSIVISASLIQSPKGPKSHERGQKIGAALVACFAAALRWQFLISESRGP